MKFYTFSQYWVDTAADGLRCPRVASIFCTSVLTWFITNHSEINRLWINKSLKETYVSTPSGKVGLRWIRLRYLDINFGSFLSYSSSGEIPYQFTDTFFCCRKHLIKFQKCVEIFNNNAYKTLFMSLFILLYEMPENDTKTNIDSKYT